jgi:long-subunit acyl-CoA synthetase (AMP-forming)
VLTSAPSTSILARQIASGLKNLGLKEGSRVGIYADTSLVLWLLACSLTT